MFFLIFTSSRSDGPSLQSPHFFPLLLCSCGSMSSPPLRLASPGFHWPGSSTWRSTCCIRGQQASSSSSFSACKRQNEECPFVLPSKPAHQLHMLQYSRADAHLRPSLTCDDSVSVESRHIPRELVRWAAQPFLPLQPKVFPHHRPVARNSDPTTLHLVPEATELSFAGNLLKLLAFTAPDAVNANDAPPMVTHVDGWYHRGSKARSPPKSCRCNFHHDASFRRSRPDVPISCQSCVELPFVRPNPFGSGSTGVRCALVSMPADFLGGSNSHPSRSSVAVFRVLTWPFKVLTAFCAASFARLSYWCFPGSALHDWQTRGHINPSASGSLVQCHS